MDKSVQSQPVKEFKENKIIVFFAQMLSYILHPVFIPFLTVLVFYLLSKPSFVAITNAQPLWLGSFALNTIFFPLVATLLMKVLGFIKSIKMDDPKDRIIPLIATMVFYFWAHQVMKHSVGPLILKVVSLSAFWGIIAMFMINIFYKISMHATAAASAVGLFIVFMIIGKYNLFVPLLIIILTAGLVGTSRLVLKAHVPFEIWLGYIVGLIIPFLAWWYLL